MNDIFRDLGIPEVPRSGEMTRADAELICDEEGGESVIAREFENLFIDACGKNGYPDRKVAEAVKKACLRKRGGELCSYFCPDCGYWHLTSTRR